VVRESSGTENRHAAKRTLQIKEGAAAEGRPVIPRADKVTIEDLFTTLEEEYTTNQRRSLDRLAILVQASPSRLRRAAGRAADQRRDHQVHHHPTTGRARRTRASTASWPRSSGPIGSHSRATACPGYLTFRCFGRTTPDRASSSARSSRRSGAVWRQSCVASSPSPTSRGGACRASFRRCSAAGGSKNQTIRLEPGTTKNSEGRTFVMTPELREVLETQRAETDRWQRLRKRIIPWVFHRRGKPIRDYRTAWRLACAKAGVPGRIPHDLRRTAVRNLERAGVPRSVAMRMVGHKTESIYRRYAIVDEAMLREGAEKLARAQADSSRQLGASP
jgi:Phage integrase family